jgi:hypothetical protein
MPVQEIFENVCPEVSDMRVGIDSRAACIELNPWGIDWRELFYQPGVSVVELDRHRGIIFKIFSRLPNDSGAKCNRPFVLSADQLASNDK